VSYPAPSRRDHERFCIVEGWERRKDARSRSGTDHVRFELVLPDGRMLYTRVSHPVDRTGYGAQFRAHIRRDQLDVTEPEFWSCVRDGQKPNRGAPAAPPAEAIPLGVVQALIQVLHIPEAEVMTMTKGEAVRRLTESYSQPGGGSPSA